MTDLVLIDNDIVVKLSHLALTDQALAELHKIGQPSLLSVSAFAIPKQVKRNRKIMNLANACERCENFMARCIKIESTEAEIYLAAQLEDVARTLDVDLDTGESLLCAIMILRETKLLITGDKRAVIALHSIPECGPLKNKVASLEQLILQILTHIDYINIRALVCSEPKCDRTLTLCFSCSSDCAKSDDTVYGLISYIRDTRVRSLDFLIQSDDLSSMVT